MDFIMTFSLLFLLLLVPAASATYMSEGAKETQFGIMPVDGISPAPTDAPGLNEIRDELRKRALAPSNWCGFIDGKPNDVYSCGPLTSCVLKSDFYMACCTYSITDLCFSSLVLPTKCIDYDTYTRYTTRIGSLTNACSIRSFPYCFTLTSYGLTQQYGCAATSYPRIHSFFPVAAYYSSLSGATSQISFPYTYSPLTPTPKITYSRTSTPISEYYSDSEYEAKPKVKLPTAAKAGIGSAASLVTLAVVALLIFCFRRRRNRARASPTDVGAVPAVAQMNSTLKSDQSAAEPKQQQYQPQPPGYQGAALPVQQQYQPQPQGYQNATQHYQPQSDNRIFTDSADSPPYYPAPVYTSGSQETPAHPIPPNKPTSDPKISSDYSASPVPSALPLAPNLHQQQHDPLPPWNYNLDSPISTINPERSELGHQETLPTHAKIGGGETGVQNHHTGTLQNDSELGAGADHSSLPRNHTELGAGAYHSSLPRNQSELGAGAYHSSLLVNQSELGAGAYHSSLPRNQSELGAGADHSSLPRNQSELGAGADHSSLPRNQSELGAGADHSSLPRNQSELPGVEEARAPYPGPPNHYNRPELGL